MTTKRATRPVSSSRNKSSEGMRSKILQAFSEEWSAEGEAPQSVGKFCKQLGISEAIFYRHFPSLRAVEKAFWKEWIDGVLVSLKEGGDWENFSAKERYLAFLFALVQSSLEKRSLLLNRFEEASPLANPISLEGFRQSFLDFAAELVRHGHETGEIAERGGLTKIYPGVLYSHLRLVIDQHLKDESDEFQRTDAFIEKTVNLAFDLFRSQALESAADLIRFLIPSEPWCRARSAAA